MLQVYKLDKMFGNQPALQGVTLQVKPGETLAVMGPSGCGKSTLLRCIHRLVPVDGGEIWFHDDPVMDLEGEALRAYRRKVGFVFQDQNLMSHLNALENVALGLRMAGMTLREAKDRATESLRRVGLDQLAGARPGEMSGGQRQRVGIARALAMRPELILWDEPTAALDPIMVEEVLSIMADLALTGETAMIVVTHEIPFALEVADRAVLMDRGRIVESGRPDDVLFRSHSELAKRFRSLYELRHAGGFGERGRVFGRKEMSTSRSGQSQPMREVQHS